LQLAGLPKPDTKDPYGSRHQFGGNTMSCSHIKSCELFVQFALNPALDIWKDYYCEGDFASCARFKKSKSGRMIPLTLLPNGSIIKEGGDDSSCGSIAIFNAILKDRKRMVASLLKVGIDINGKNIDGITPLMAAAQYGRNEIAKVLLDNGADLHAENVYGETALQIAEKRGFPAVVKILADRSGAAELKTGT